MLLFIVLCALQGILDMLLALVVFIPMRLIKIFNHEPFDRWLYTKKPDSTTAIVLIHGSGANEAQFIPARRILENKVRIYSCDLNRNGAYKSNAEESIETYASRAERYIRQNVLTIPTDNLVVVGHSMGGLVGGYLVDRLPIKLLVTVGTPWKGARALKYVFGYPGFNTTRHAQMKPGSRFLREVNEKIRNKKDLTIMTIGCKYDFQVLENDSHIGIDNEIIETANTGHIRAIVLRDTWKKITEKIIF